MLHAIMTPKGKPTANAARSRYALDLAVERITMRPTERYCTAAMQRGTDMEPLARMWYYCQRNTPVRQVGFWLDADGVSGASPDGLVGERGAIEIKCPGIAEYCRIIATGEVPPDHELQCHHVMYATGRQWVDYVLFTDVEPFSGWIMRIERNPIVCGYIHKCVIEFDAGVDRLKQTIIRNAQLRPEMLVFDPPAINADGEQDMSTGEMKAEELRATRRPASTTGPNICMPNN